MTNYQFTIRYSLFAIHYSLFTIRCSLPSKVRRVLAPLLCFPFEDTIRVGVLFKPLLGAIDEIEDGLVVNSVVDGGLCFAVTDPGKGGAGVCVDRLGEPALLAEG